MLIQRDTGHHGRPAHVSLTALLILVAGAASAAAAPPPAPPASGISAGSGCLPTGDGYLKARIRGARNLDIDWHNTELECQGETRPDGSGIRMSFAGPARADGRRLRLVFGVRARTEGGAGRALPTNLTIIFEGERRLFATRGDDKCTVDQLSQRRIADHPADVTARSYRVVARGFCIAPASAIGSNERIVVESFDFAGRLVYAGKPKGTLPRQAALPTKQGAAG